jgi:hypothetical protein
MRARLLTFLLTVAVALGPTVTLMVDCDCAAGAMGQPSTVLRCSCGEPPDSGDDAACGCCCAAEDAPQAPAPPDQAPASTAPAKHWATLPAHHPALGGTPVARPGRPLLPALTVPARGPDRALLCVWQT